MTGRAYGGPEMYVQRSGEVARLGAHVAALGRTALFVMDAIFEQSHGAEIARDLGERGVGVHIERFGGECSAPEVERLVARGRGGGSDVVVSFGGGKAADTAKLVALELGARLVIVPTIASTDAPCSAVAVRYTVGGEVDRIFNLPRHPDRVIVDPALIAKAPVRFLVAGIGDALSTWFEARSNRETRSRNYIGDGYHASLAALAIARQCHETLMRDGLAAIASAQAGRVTPALENVIEANTLLSGLGFENCGCSAAHGIHNGMTALHQTHGLMHGEKVAFGVLVLLVLEGRPHTEFAEVLAFCRAIGLPTTLADLNLADVTDEDLSRLAQVALRDGEATHAAFAEVSVEAIISAIRAVDALARRVAG